MKNETPSGLQQLVGKQVVLDLTREAEQALNITGWPVFATIVEIDRPMIRVEVWSTRAWLNLSEIKAIRG